MADNLDSIEQGYAIKFTQKEGENGTSAYLRLRAVYGEQCLSRTQVFEWFKQFKCGLSKRLLLSSKEASWTLCHAGKSTLLVTETMLKNNN